MKTFSYGSFAKPRRCRGCKKQMNDARPLCDSCRAQKAPRKPKK